LEFNGRTLRVSEANKKDDSRGGDRGDRRGNDNRRDNNSRDNRGNNRESDTLKINDLPENVSESDLRNAFGK